MGHNIIDAPYKTMIQPPQQVVDTYDRGVHFEEGTVFAFFSYCVTLCKFQ
jgi:hypothetical protein